MITILLRLLLIQMTIQFDLAADLEGRTSHYVNLLDSSASDISALRITCPVYTIRPAGKTAKFTKYTATAAQHGAVNDWEDRTNALTFKDCASQAATDDAKMFIFDDGACTISNTLFTRLPETCGDDNVTVVYMVDPPENGCVDGYIWIEDGEDTNGLYCDFSSIYLTCRNGKIYGYDPDGTVYFRTEEGCFSIHDVTSAHYSFYESECSSLFKPRGTCKPDDEASRPAFLQNIKDMAVNADPRAAVTEFMVDCSYNAGDSSFSWLGDVVQPTTVAGEWKNGFPTNPTSSEYVYMTPEGLMNGVASGVSQQVCCYKAN